VSSKALHCSRHSNLISYLFRASATRNGDKVEGFVGSKVLSATGFRGRAARPRLQGGGTMQTLSSSSSITVLTAKPWMSGQSCGNVWFAEDVDNAHWVGALDSPCPSAATTLIVKAPFAPRKSRLWDVIADGPVVSNDAPGVGSTVRTDRWRRLGSNAVACPSLTNTQCV
jgi:hypothetical protein